MPEVVLAHQVDFATWRKASSHFVRAGVLPESIFWQVAQAGQELRGLPSLRKTHQTPHKASTFPAVLWGCWPKHCRRMIPNGLQYFTVLFIALRMPDWH